MSTTSAGASTLVGFTLANGGSNTATFSPIGLQSISGWTPGSVTYNGMTYTIVGGTTTFTKGVMDTLTISGAVMGLSGLSNASNLLTIAWTPSTADDGTAATSPNLTYLYAGANYTFNPILLNAFRAITRCSSVRRASIPTSACPDALPQAWQSCR